ncbi:YihY/virulence factor BrkB family protein [Nocardioides daeguensis]|uniref:Inner membrane protein YhjD n=1 Tax=Nocardioides daeguensis TaxID=908359 RepID=A0ABP6W619_9ACTN|nr:YihY/virulence factor BrkB family protein [Nocardioides daeguensis]MBV6727733.1 YihY/virulence factor BrkB family protein [Nocardioides daeguensis]MCR1775205.1 YihY/virulence factor BrkB family protein [Nocardioides daeguensis]
MKLVERAKAKLADLRERWPLVDHAVRTQEHYAAVEGSQQAGGVTYFGFLSVFPILALAFFVVGWVSQVFPDAQDTLVKAINEVLPGLVGHDDGQVDLTEIQDAARTVGIIGLVGVLYAGLGWLSSVQSALVVLFEMPARLRPGFVVGKLRDLVTLTVLGAVLFASVIASAVLTRTSRGFLDLVGIGAQLGWLVAILAVLVGLAASALLFFLMFRLLVRPALPQRALWSGAALGAIGFEILKQLSGLLLTSTRGQPAFQAFGIALILLVWINYFSRVILYAAAWAQTSPLAARPPAPVPAADAIAAAVAARPADGQHAPSSAPAASVLSFVAGSVAGALVTRVGRRSQRSGRLER